ncbi:hypothetical protein HWV62_37067 [Athelia sp. TMB]|nr:hypothetical protein HWV62_37067 [Athelia sp. TMB]
MAPLLELSALLGVVIPLFIILYVVYASLSQQLRRARLPPGPAGWPIIGNVLDVPKSGAEWIDYRNMGEKYNSDIIYMNVFGTRILVLNSFEAIIELLEKRSVIYSSRLKLRSNHNLEWAGLRHSRFCHMEALGDHIDAFSTASLICKEKNRSGITHIKYATAQNPGSMEVPYATLWWDINSNGHSQTGSTVLEIAYGIRAETDDDPHIAAAEMAVRYASDGATPGRYLVDTLPWLKYVPAWVPGASFQVVAQESKKVITASLSVPFEEVKAAMVSNLKDLTKYMVRSRLGARLAVQPILPSRRGALRKWIRMVTYPTKKRL